jgi:hypothetical protein
MMAMTAIVRPTDSVEALHLLEQCFRRNFTALRVREDQLLLRVPGIGRLLVTDELARIRLEFLTDSDRVSEAIAALEKTIMGQVSSRSLRIEWAESAVVPASLR